MQIKTEHFKTLAAKALRNKTQQEALARASFRFSVMRSQAFQSWPEAESVRTEAQRIKAEAMEDLPRLLDQLQRSCKALGVQVHRSPDAEDACGRILELIRSRGVKLVVKSKSMTTEEIDLNRRLEENRTEVWETDLGEFIVQLAGEPPSHIIGPAVHKTQQEVAELFAAKLGVPVYQTPEELTMVAREFLREKYFRADMGISGANFAVAQTGTVVILENEGNARFCTTFPRIHVIVMGMEKVIPGLGELNLFLKLLARSATGQKASTYVSLIRGPRRLGEADGPEEVHLIILDNGRSRIREDSIMRPSLFCLRCGACLNVCPVYQKIGGHAYGWVYSGPIGASIVPQYVGLLRSRDLPMASTLCGACAQVCPVRIPIPDLLLELRHRIQDLGGGGLFERGLMELWARTQSHPAWYRASTAVIRMGQRIFPDRFPRGLTPPDETFHQWWKHERSP
jgi:L-lactate dehydrogenase complex protein LldF